MIYGLVGEIKSEVWRLQLEIFYEKKKKIADGSDGEESHVGGFLCSREIFLASFIVNLTDVHTVRSLVEEMETESNEEITESEEVQQGLGKRVLGKYRHYITVWLIS